MEKTLTAFIENNGHIPASLIRAVVKQLGGWNEDTHQNLKDIASHGIDGGFHGFIYYTDTVEFFKRNKKSILAMAENEASDIDEAGIFAMFSSFGCMKQYSQDEIVWAVCAGKGENVDQIFNCLAWYAGETVARAFDDNF